MTLRVGHMKSRIFYVKVKIVKLNVEEFRLYRDELYERERR